MIKKKKFTCDVWFWISVLDLEIGGLLLVRGEGESVSSHSNPVLSSITWSQPIFDIVKRAQFGPNKFHGLRVIFSWAQSTSFKVKRSSILRIIMIFLQYVSIQCKILINVFEQTRGHSRTRISLFLNLLDFWHVGQARAEKLKTRNVWEFGSLSGLGSLNRKTGYFCNGNDFNIFNRIQNPTLVNSDEIRAWHLKSGWDSSPIETFDLIYSENLKQLKVCLRC